MLHNVLKVGELRKRLEEFDNDDAEIYLSFNDTQTNRYVQLFIDEMYIEPDDDSLGSFCVMEIKYYEEL